VETCVIENASQVHSLNLKADFQIFESTVHSGYLYLAKHWDQFCVYSCFWETRRRATECHLPYRITVLLAKLPPNTGKCILLEPQPSKLVQNLPAPEGWIGEMNLVFGYILRWFTCFYVFFMLPVYRELPIHIVTSG